MTTPICMNAHNNLENAFGDPKDYVGANLFGTSTDEGGVTDQLQAMMTEHLLVDQERLKYTWSFDCVLDKPIHRSDSRLEYLPDNITGQYENVQNCPLLSESKPIPHLQSQFRARKFTYGSDTSDYHSYNAANDDNQTFDPELDADLQGLELDQSNEKQTA